MRRILVAIGLTLTLILIVLGGVSAAAADTVAGNRVIDRPNVDSWTNTYLVNKNHPFNAAGNVNRCPVIPAASGGGWYHGAGLKPAPTSAAPGTTR